mgnify:CR=1 FL=1
MVSCENIETTGSTMVFNSQKVVKSFQIRDSTDVYGSTYVKNSMEVKKLRHNFGFAKSFQFEER